MRLCRLISDTNQIQLGFFYDDYVIPAITVHEALRIAAYGAIPLFPSPDDNTLKYLPPNWDNYRLLNYLATMADTLAHEEDLQVPLEDVYFDIPVPMPNKVICLAGNYAEHIAESGGKAAKKEETFPFFFMKPPSTTIRASGTAVALPATSPDFIDWEVELVAVIGSYVKDIPVEQAKDAIAGYTIGLDMSNRRLRLNPNRVQQDRTAYHEWLCGKWHDGFAPIGPCIVAADDEFDPMNCAISLAVNGEVMQDSNTKNMVFDVYELVSYASKIMTLEPGDLIMTGTPSGVGDARGRYLKSEDRIEASIEGIGTLKVQIV